MINHDKSLSVTFSHIFHPVNPYFWMLKSSAFFHFCQAKGRAESRVVGHWDLAFFEQDRPGKEMVTVVDSELGIGIMDYLPVN